MTIPPPPPSQDVGASHPCLDPTSPPFSPHALKCPDPAVERTTTIKTKATVVAATVVAARQQRKGGGGSVVSLVEAPMLAARQRRWQ